MISGIKSNLYAIAAIVLALMMTGIAYAATISEATMARIAQLETQYQLPRGVMAKVAQLESSGNANAANGRAVGLFQFMPCTWYQNSAQLYCPPGTAIPQCTNNQNVPALACAARQELRTDPIVSAEVAAVYLARIRNSMKDLAPRAGVDMMVALRLGHFLGEAGGPRFMNLLIADRNAPAAPSFGGSNPDGAAQRNRTIFYKPTGEARSFGEIIQLFAQQMQRPGITGVTGGTGVFDGNINDPSRIIGSASLYGLSQPFLGPVPGPDPVRTLRPDPIFNQGGTGNPQPTEPSGPISSGTENASLIIVQPKTVRTGGSVLVSWTSVGMQPNSCEIKAQGASYTQGQSEGSQRFTAPTAAGTVEFILMCIDKQGSPVGSQTVLTVQ